VPGAGCENWTAFGVHDFISIFFIPRSCYLNLWQYLRALAAAGNKLRNGQVHVLKV